VSGLFDTPPPSDPEYDALVLLANAGYWDHTDPEACKEWDEARDRWRNAFHARLSAKSENLVVQEDRQPKLLYAYEWLNVRDGNVLVFRHPEWSREDTTTFIEEAARRLRESGAGDVLVVSLPYGCELSIKDEEAMRQCGSPRTPDVESPAAPLAP
jgi:hypothetical protein